MTGNGLMRVLLVGATGVFGCRLAEGLTAEKGIVLILAGRTAEALEQLKEELGGTAEVAVLDRNKVLAEDINMLGVGLVIDASGPFQESRMALIKATIAAGCHYIDLADGRDFVTGIRDFNSAARARGVLVLSGASTTPALSHAVVDRLTRDWSRIERIEVAISPGNRAPRGLAVVRAILSYSGRPVRVFKGGAWTTVPGWGLTRRLEFPGLGNRLVSLCETPDLDLFVERYHPQDAALFLAGLELPILHYGLVMASLPVRLGLLKSLKPLARPLRFLASLFLAFGTDRGGMVVTVSGRDAEDRPARARWSLLAEEGKGPYVPTLAALALTRRLRDQALAASGAEPCIGFLDLSEFEADFERHGIVTHCESAASS